VLVAGLLDQGSLLATGRYGENKKRWASDEDVVRRIEAALPSGASVFELPYVPFPEGPRTRGVDGYDALRPYLHSRALRWSSPTMRDRGADGWVRDVANREPKQMIEALARAGFGGILLDREGYEDHGAALEAAFGGALSASPTVSADGRLAFFDLTGHGESPAGGVSPEEVARRRYLAAHPLAWSWDDGCYGLEHDASRTFRWCASAGEIHVDNDAPFARRVSVSAMLYAARPPARLTLAGELASGDLELPTQLVRVVDVPPGRHAIRFTCDGRPADAPTDPRTMVWQVASFTFDEEGSGPPPP